MAASAGVKTSELAKKIDDYLHHLQKKGSSPLTLRNYKHYLNRLLRFISETKKSPNIRDISDSLIQEYRKSLVKRRLSLKTQGYHLIALRSFLRWLRRCGVGAYEPERINVPKAKPSRIKFLTGREVDRLLNAPSLSKIFGKRDKAILEILYSTGLRVSDLTNLDRESIDFDKKEARIVGRKGRARAVFLSSRAAKWIENYLKARKDRYKPLFIRHKGKMVPSIDDEKMRLTPRSVQRMVKKYARKIKLPVDVSPHVIRHSFAADLLMAGADTKSVQKMLGHKNIQTTQIYTHVTHRHLQDIHSAFHGKGES